MDKSIVTEKFQYLAGIVVYISSIIAAYALGYVTHIAFILICTAVYFISYGFPAFLDSVDESDVGHSIWGIIAMFALWPVAAIITWQFLPLPSVYLKNFTPDFSSFSRDVVFYPWVFSVLSVVTRLAADEFMKRPEFEEIKKKFL